MSEHDRFMALAAAFSEAYGYHPYSVWTAPGRVNVLGEHTDYNDGFVLPMALEQSCLVAVAPARSKRGGTPGVSTVRSVQRPGEKVTFRASAVEPGDLEGWAAYVAGSFWSLRELGLPVPDLDLMVDSDVPVGAGLSSSAALECAVATMLAKHILSYAGQSAGWTPSSSIAPLPRLTRTEIALAAQRVENEFVGVPTGSMDQLASMHGRKDHVCFIDTRSNTVIQVPFDLSAQGLSLLVIDTRAPHQLVDSEYGERRRGCESAARNLGVTALRDVPEADLAHAEKRLTDDHERAYLRHIVTEDARVLDVVQILASGGDPRDIGPALTASHASMRDDFRISVPQLDVAVDTALAAGAYGARMTGGGFGGCAIALIDADAMDRVVAEVRAAFESNGFDPPESFVAVPSDGARLVVRFGEAHAS